MITNYSEALDWLYAQPTGKSKNNLSYVKSVLEKLGNPHRQVPVIHVTGTNGKGSTIAFLSQILQAHGLKVATFTSPHLITFNERFQINQDMISNQDIVTYLNRLAPYQLTQFELFTCLFFLYMADYKPDVAIVEVGIGGLLDTTNVVNPAISVITSVGLDHLELLGDTIEAIAEQKAGIIKPKTPVLIGKVPANCLTIFKRAAAISDSPLLAYGIDFDPEHYQVERNGIAFQLAGVPFQTEIVGHHQLYNATLALMCAKSYLKTNYQDALAQKGISQTRWAGRMEKVSENPLIYIDGAHNKQGIDALIETINEKFEPEYVKIIFGALSRKNYSDMLKRLAYTYKTYVTTFEYEQSASLEELKKIDAPVFPVSNWKTAIQENGLQSGNDIIVFTGSLYFISEVKAYFDAKTYLDN